MIRRSKGLLTMIVNNAMVLAAMVFLVSMTGSLWPLILILALVGVTDDKEETE